MLNCCRRTSSACWWETTTAPLEFCQGRPYRTHAQNKLSIEAEISCAFQREKGESWASCHSLTYIRSSHTELGIVSVECRLNQVSQKSVVEGMYRYLRGEKSRDTLALENKSTRSRWSKEQRGNDLHPDWLRVRLGATV